LTQEALLSPWNRNARLVLGSARALGEIAVVTNQEALDAARHHERSFQHQWFHRFATETGKLAGKPIAFILAAIIIAAWAITGPIFNYSDTWQLVINTGTTIITFLMVFLIQHSQNRDTAALHVKLSELIIAMKGARNELAAADDLDEEDLEEMREKLKQEATRPEEKRAGRLSNG
jgi:low affinity Fe/Cu permease